jgi:hypothetical protein
MQDLGALAFVDEDGDVRVNFGVFAGREVTPAEIDELARTLLEDAESVTIVAEHRFVVDREGEASVHQIRVELAGRPPDGPLAIVRRWAQDCIADRAIEIEGA